MRHSNSYPRRFSPRKIDVVNPPPDEGDLIRAAFRSTGAISIDWDDPYEPGLVVVTRLRPNTKLIIRHSRVIYLALAFNITILDCSWLIRSYLIGKWLPKASYTARTPSYNELLFDGIAVAVSLPGLRGEDVTAMSVALGAILLSDECDVEKLSLEIELLVVIAASSKGNSIWGMFPGSWNAEMKCIELGIRTMVRDEFWFYRCIQEMRVG